MRILALELLANLKNFPSVPKYNALNVLEFAKFYYRMLFSISRVPVHL